MSATLRSNRKEIWPFSSWIFIGFSNWANESIKKHKYTCMKGKFLSLCSPSLLGTFQNRSSWWFQPPWWSRSCASGCYETESQVSIYSINNIEINEVKGDNIGWLMPTSFMWVVCDEYILWSLRYCVGMHFFKSQETILSITCSLTLFAGFYW